MSCTDCTHDGTRSLRAHDGVWRKHSPRLWSLAVERTRPAVPRLLDGGAGRRTPRARALDEARRDRAERHRSRKPAYGQRPQHRNERRSYGSWAREPDGHHELTTGSRSRQAARAGSAETATRGRVLMAPSWSGALRGAPVFSRRSLVTSAAGRSRGTILGAPRHGPPRASSRRRSCERRRPHRGARAASFAARQSAEGRPAAASTALRDLGIAWRQAWVGVTWSAFPWGSPYVDRTRGETRPTRARNAPSSQKREPRATRGPPPASVTAG
jgi:hypothetical protein